MGIIAKGFKAIVKAVVGVVKGVVKVLGKVAFGLIGMVLGRGNAANQATDGRLSKNLEPEDHRKIIFGQTAGAQDLRFWEISGDKNDRYHEIIAIASHTIEDYLDFYIETDKLAFQPNGVHEGNKYFGVYKQVHKGDSAAPLTGVGAGTYWNSSCKFTGVAHYHLRWKVTDETLPNGVPSRYTYVVKGAKVYDPRKDSTRGGSGSHRADDQTTWEYAPVDSNGKPIGRNNALQMLWYIIGWRINGKLVAGRGIDLADINFEEFIAAANDAEARGFYTDMILSTGDSHETNEGIISADGLLGELLDPGGLWTYKIIKDDTADVAVHLTDDDVLEGGDVEWTPALPMGDQFNEVGGSYIDASETSLYQSKAYPTVIDTAYQTLDGFKKRATHNFQSVQDPELAQRLARLKLNRSRFSGEFKAVFSMRALKAQVWSVVKLSLERYGFAEKLFRVYSQSVSEAGVEMILKEDDPLIYVNGSIITPPADDVIVPYDPSTTYPVTNLTATRSSIIDTAGNTQVGVDLAWDEPSGQVQRLETQYKLTSASTWTDAPNVPGTALGTSIMGLLGSTSYDFRVRSVSLNGVPSAWATVSKTTGATTSGSGGTGSGGMNELQDAVFGRSWSLNVE